MYIFNNNICYILNFNYDAFYDVYALNQYQYHFQLLLLLIKANQMQSIIIHIDFNHNYYCFIIRDFPNNFDKSKHHFIN